MWRLPLPEVEKRRLESKVADRKNTGHRYGGAIHAALFLRDFVADGVPWAHLDIAGPAFNEEADDAEIPAGGTGFGVRTLLELLGSTARTVRDPEAEQPMRRLSPLPSNTGWPTSTGFAIRRSPSSVRPASPLVASRCRRSPAEPFEPTSPVPPPAPISSRS